MLLNSGKLSSFLERHINLEYVFFLNFGKMCYGYREIDIFINVTDFEEMQPELQLLSPSFTLSLLILSVGSCAYYNSMV